MSFTKITHAGIGSTGTVLLENLEVTGVGTFGGSVSVGGTLTYEDVTNVDSVGLVTARNGIVVGSGITLSKDGDGFFTGIVTATSFVGSGANLTGVASTENIRTNTNATFLQNVTVVGTSTVTGNIVPSSDSATDIGTNSVRFQNAYVDTYYGSGANLTGISQVGGATGVDFNDNVKARFGTGNDLEIYANGSTSIIDSTNQNIDIQSSGAINIKPADAAGITAFNGGAVELYHNATKKFETTSAGVTITGAQTVNSGGATSVFNCGATDTAIYLNSTSTNGPHMRFQYDGTDIHYVGSGDGFTPSADREDFAIRFKDRFFFSRDNTNCWYIDGDMHFIPASNNTYDIGRSDTRVRNIYTADLHCSNKGLSNDVDGTWGDYTIQEGESDLFLINNRNGKKYKFNLTEVS